METPKRREIMKSGTCLDIPRSEFVDGSSDMASKNLEAVNGEPALTGDGTPLRNRCQLLFG